MRTLVLYAFGTALLLLAPVVSAPKAAAQSDGESFTADICRVLSPENYVTCCADVNRERVLPYLTAEGRAICEMSSDQQARFFEAVAAEELAQGRKAKGKPVTDETARGKAGAGRGPGAGDEEGQDVGGGSGTGGGDTLGNPGNDEEVGRAGESPGGKDFGYDGPEGGPDPGPGSGGSFGKSDVDNPGNPGGGKGQGGGQGQGNGNSGK